MCRFTCLMTGPPCVFQCVYWLVLFTLNLLADNNMCVLWCVYWLVLSLFFDLFIHWILWCFDGIYSWLVLDMNFDVLMSDAQSILWCVVNWCWVYSLVLLLTGYEYVLWCGCSLVLRAFSALLQKKPGFPLVAIIAMSVMGALILCLAIVLVWLAKKKNSRKSVGKLMYQPNQLLINNKFGLA